MKEDILSDLVARFYWAVRSRLPRRKYISLDSSIRDSCYTSIYQCRILQDGKSVLFGFENGVYYVVDSGYLRSWFPYPTRIRQRKGWIEFSEGHHESAWNPTDEIRVVSTRRIHEPCLSSANRKVWGEVMLYLNNGEMVVAHDDRILAGCEPSWDLFEAFGFGNRFSREDAKAVLEMCGRNPEEPMVTARRSTDRVFDDSWNTINAAEIRSMGKRIWIRLKGGESFLLPASSVYKWTSSRKTFICPLDKEESYSLLVEDFSLRPEFTAIFSI